MSAALIITAAVVAVFRLAFQQLAQIIRVNLGNRYFHPLHLIEPQTQVAAAQRVEVQGFFAAGEAQARPGVAHRNGLAERRFQRPAQGAAQPGRQRQLVGFAHLEAAF